MAVAIAPSDEQWELEADLFDRPVDGVRRH
jgi:hypothetical protein